MNYHRTRSIQPVICHGQPKRRSEAADESPTQEWRGCKLFPKHFLCLLWEPIQSWRIWHDWGCCCDKVTDYRLPVPDLPPQQILDKFCGRGSANEYAGALSSTAKSVAKRFAPRKTEEEIEKARISSIPKRTREDTAYCVRLWLSWSEYRAATTGIPVPSLAILSATTKVLQYWLIRFIHEIRKKDSSEYPPNTLHHIISVIMRHIHHDCGRLEIDFFNDPGFSDFCSSLDVEMKRLQSAGLGSERKQAEPLTLEEEQLWEILGDHNPKALLNTIMFMNGLYFTLRSGEHHQLRHAMSHAKSS